MSLSTQISNAEQAADIEMTTFLNSMSDSQRGSYAGENMMTALNRVKAAKLDRFQYMAEDLTGTDNNITSTAYYVQRAADMTKMANDFNAVATKQLNSSSINSGLLGRQEEINQWANNNKLDTLFFLQILFVTLTFISSMVFLNSNGLISSYLLNLFIVLAAFFAVFVLITRARKTSVLRDGRYWSKFRFGGAKAPPMKSTEKCPGDAAPPPVEVPASSKSTCNSNLSLLGDMPAELPIGWGGKPPSN
jgi:hypothetical protein